MIFLDLMNKLLLILGPSGVGKSSIIQEILRLDKQFMSMPTYTTRSLRIGEKEKTSISSRKLLEMQNRDELLEINELYGNYYATPILPIIKAFAGNKIPILDWPVSRLGVMRKAFPGQLYTVYLSPPSVEVLKQRLLNDGRSANGSRLQIAQEELKEYWSGRYVNLCNLNTVSHEGKQVEIAKMICKAYKLSVFENRDKSV